VTVFTLGKDAHFCALGSMPEHRWRSSLRELKSEGGPPVEVGMGPREEAKAFSSVGSSAWPK